jgi:uncharacterized membrane protein YgaE (UPF0421/DUF939 family)
MTNPKPGQMTERISVREAILHGVTLAVLCVISYWLITQILAHVFYVSRDDNLLGGMWAVVATIFVYRWSYAPSVGAALSRIAATVVSFALCFVYLLFLPFHLWGMAALIGIGAIVVSLLGRPDDIITTGITTAVVMVVAAISPDHAWKEPILRLLDTMVGSAVGIVGALVGPKVNPAT